MLSKVEECTSETEVGKSVDVLSAIRWWISKAWNEVKEETIQKCFRKAGLLDADLNPLTRVYDIDPFAEADAQLQDLITQALPTGESCPVEEYIDGECSLPTCQEFNSETWDTNFLDSIIPDRNGDDDDEVNSDNDEDVAPPPPKLKDVCEAIVSLEDVKTFLEYHGFMEDSSKVHSCIDSIAAVVLPGKQTDIRSYFQPI